MKCVLIKARYMMVCGQTWPPHPDIKDKARKCRGSTLWLRHLLWNCPNMNVTGLKLWKVNIGSGNGLVPSGNKSLSEPMLTHISVAIWCHTEKIIAPHYWPFVRGIHQWPLNRPQIPQCIFPISQNTPLGNRNVYISAPVWCIVGYETGALWAGS